VRIKAHHSKEVDMAESDSHAHLQDGDPCTVVKGTHKGKSGTVGDIHTSKSGAVTITVEQVNGQRFKTLARNVALTKGA